MSISSFPVSDFDSPSPTRRQQEQQLDTAIEELGMCDAHTQTDLISSDIDRLLQLDETGDTALNADTEQQSLCPWQATDGTNFLSVSEGQRLLVLGGATDQFTSTVEEYDAEGQTWKEMCEIPPGVEWMSAACTARGSVVYVIGEVDYNYSKNIGVLWKMQEMKGCWETLPRLRKPRVHLSLVNQSMGLFALGGSLEKEAVDVVEVFDVEKQMWMDAPHMEKPRAQFSAISVSGAIYVLGGMTPQTIYRSGEMHDPREGCWHKQKKMQIGRTGFALAYHNNNIFAIGGYGMATNSKSNLLASTEMLDLRMPEWQPGPDLHYARGWCTASVFKDQPFVIGGKNDLCGEQSNAPIEFFDWSKREWIVSSATLCSGHRAFCSAVLIPSIT